MKNNQWIILLLVSVIGYFAAVKMDVLKGLVNSASATTNATVAGVASGLKNGTVTSGAPSEKGWYDKYGNA